MPQTQEQKAGKSRRKDNPCVAQEQAATWVLLANVLSSLPCLKEHTPPPKPIGFSSCLRPSLPELVQSAAWTYISQG
jgi:hypothetical protein